MKNITFSADSILIEKARNRALQEKSTLNVKFREWLEAYAYGIDISDEEFISILDANTVDTGAPFTRKELNER